MILVPRQLQRAGMTGDVPYYGGRLMPAQAYAVSHPHGDPPPALAQGTFAARSPSPSTAVPAAATAPAGSPGNTLQTLTELLDSGVITAAEYQDLRARITP